MRYLDVYDYKMEEAFTFGLYEESFNTPSIDTYGYSSLFVFITSGVISGPIDFSVRIQGSDEDVGSSFVNVDISDLVTIQTSNPFDLAEDTPYTAGIISSYRYYRLRLVETIGMSEVQLLGAQWYLGIPRHNKSDTLETAF